MKKQITTLTFAFALVFGAACAEAVDAAAPAGGEQDAISLLRAELRMDKRAFVKASMPLNDDEAKKFWTIYNQYEADLMKVNDRKLKVIEDYADNYDDLSEDKAAELVQDMFDVRESRSKIVKNYYKKVAKALSNKIAMRFVQIESVWIAAADLKISSAMPLIPKQ
ncbi:hypothetical protein RP726_15985 [Candidatus Methylospira mobilis]|uniref:hypothetical protein n=1 Tax=Candidatus Methylospira mobilis TaxID=1808979 RepID=UPI0028E54119|nr:hypothetical protein [Candidatus Methylospira mobilis]WNV03916.1 hypothetical protein RP726_15985 [Candidatus Methylospira mobilis]